AARAVIGVVAAAFEEGVVVDVAGDVVGAGAGADILEIGDGVAAPARILGRQSGQVDRRRGRAGEDQSVHAQAAVERVVAEPSLDGIGVAVTGQDVGVRAADQVLDAAQGGDRAAGDGGGAVQRV